jgi:diguanylate cyclase (GGDEF)-like protein
MQTGSKRAGAPKKGGIAGLHPILEVLKEMNSERNLRRLITMILDTLIRFSNAHRGSIAFFKGDRFNAELSRDQEGCEISHSDISTLGSVLMRVNEQGEALVIEDVRADARIRDPRILIPGYDAHSILCLPLRVKSRLVGAVYLDNTLITYAFGARQREFAQILTDHAAIAIENSMLERQNTLDRTTGVSNHAHLEHLLDGEMERARRFSQPCGLLMIDVDDFKQVNDRYGHAVGTEVLRRIAQTLTTTLRGMDIVGRREEPSVGHHVGRYGGDEFEVILPNTSRGGVLDAAARLLQAVLASQHSAGGQVLKVSITIGAAVYPHDAADMNELFIRADQALYLAKRAGKGRVSLYSEAAALEKTPRHHTPIQRPSQSP